MGVGGETAREDYIGSWRSDGSEQEMVCSSRTNDKEGVAAMMSFLLRYRSSKNEGQMMRSERRSQLAKPSLICATRSTVIGMLVHVLLYTCQSNFQQLTILHSRQCHALRRLSRRLSSNETCALAA